MNAGKSKVMVGSRGGKMIINSGSGPVVSVGRSAGMYKVDLQAVQ